METRLAYPTAASTAPGSVADKSNTRHRRPIVTRVRPPVPGRHLLILTVLTGRDAAPLLDPVETTVPNLKIRDVSFLVSRDLHLEAFWTPGWDGRWSYL